MLFLKAQMKQARLKGFAFFVMLAFSPIGSSTAQYTQVDQLTRQVSQMRGEIQFLSRALQNTQGELVVMQKQSGLGSAGAPSNTAALEVRTASLEAQLRNMTGELERLDFKLRQEAKNRENFEQQILIRMRELEEQVATVGVPNPERLLNPVVPQNLTDSNGDVGVVLSGFPSEGVDVNAALESAFDPYKKDEPILTDTRVESSFPTDAQALYENALINLQSGQYESSQAMFEAFLTEYGETQLASNASYWLGETFYSRGDFTRAALQFSDGFTKYRDGNKSADHLLKLGLSLARLNRFGEACASYNLLQRRYLNQRPSLAERATVESSQLNCAAQ